MFFLLKNIRKKLMQNRKIGAYILYALGEIVLVVAGILIAVKIDAWNQRVENRKLEQNYLMLLKDEFQYNLKRTKVTMGLNTNTYDRGVILLGQTGPEKPRLSSARFDSLLTKTIIYEVQIRPKSKIIDELISSGKVRLIRNDTLRRQITGWPQTVDYVENIENGLAVLRKDVEDFVVERMNLRAAANNAFGDGFGISKSRFENTNEKLLNSLEFESRLIRYVFTSRLTNARYGIFQNEIEYNLQLIDRELNKIPAQ
jgi:hypothetical protein